MTRLAQLVEADYALPEDEAARFLSPALTVHLDRVRDNLRRVLAYAGGDVERWRPHVKSSKIPAVFAELGRVGLRRFKCATAREAWHLLHALGDEGILEADVLLAYPLVGPGLERLAQVARRFPDAELSVLCEDPRLVGEVPQELSIFVDVNPGMNRTGVPLADRATLLALARAAGPRFRGIHYYDGHLHSGGFDERQAEVFACYESCMELLSWLASEGVAVDELITSGTPTFQHALAYAPFRELGGTAHRISPGTVVYHDTRSEDENERLDLVPAAAVFSRVVSHPAREIATCDAGSKSLAAEAGDPCAFVIGHADWRAQTPNEEHLPLRVPAADRPQRGRAVYLVPRHVCPTINLAEEAILLDRGEIVGIVPVSARAHEIRLDG